MIHYCEEDLRKIDIRPGTIIESESEKKSTEKIIFNILILVRINIQKSLATQIQEITNGLRYNQKKLFDYVKKYNNSDGVDFLRLSEEKMLEMRDTEIDDHKNEMELMEDLVQDR